MRFPIAWRLGLVLVLVGVLGAGLTGYFAYRVSRDQLVKASEERLLTATHVLLRQVTVALQGTAAISETISRSQTSPLFMLNCIRSSVSAYAIGKGGKVSGGRCG